MTGDMFDAVLADLDRLRYLGGQIEERLPATTNGPSAAGKPRRIQGEFLKGPIPLKWLSAASKLPGKAPLAVGLAI